MKTDATIERPSIASFVILDGSLAVLAALAISPGLADQVRRRVPIPSNRVLRWILIAAGVVHLGEGVVAWRLAQAKGLNARSWAVQTTLVGFPSLVLLRRSKVAKTADSATITDFARTNVHD